jgi:formylglycine-generating enzyme required for sulfatase activity
LAGTIFINYRRGESLKDAQHLTTLIEKHFPHRKVFLDVHGIDGGEHWLHTLERQVAESDVMVTLIGAGWLDLKDEDGKRRLDDPNDFVRFEIAQALTRDIPILPVLVDGAKMPRTTQLPENLMELTRFQALPLRTESVTQDAATIAARLKSLLEKRRPPRTPIWITAAAAAIALAVGTAFGAFVLNRPSLPPGAMQEQLQKAVNDLRSVNSELGSMTKERNEAKDDLLKALRERDQAQGRLADAGTKLAEIEKRIGGADSEVAKGRAEAEQLRGSLATAQRERDQARKDLSDANARIGDLQKLLAAAQRTAEGPAKGAGDRRDPAVALRPGSAIPFRDRLTNGEPCPMCPEMVVVPSGSVIMGSPPTEPEREPVFKGTESPPIKVTIAKPFAVGRFAVTRGEFAAFVGETGYKLGGSCAALEDSEWKVHAGWSLQSPGFVQDDWHPVVCVSWEDATAYITWLTNKTGKRYRLLSESEREYVTRAGTVTAFWWGASVAAGRANYSGARTVREESGAPNPWGLYNVHGNAFEMTDDCWNVSHEGNPSDGTARATGDCENRVIRGGSWRSPSSSLRSAFRMQGLIGYPRNDAGFRIARAID